MQVAPPVSDTNTASILSAIERATRVANASIGLVANVLSGVERLTTNVVGDSVRVARESPAERVGGSEPPSGATARCTTTGSRIATTTTPR